MKIKIQQINYSKDEDFSHNPRNELSLNISILEETDILHKFLSAVKIGEEIEINDSKLKEIIMVNKLKEK